MRLSSTMCLLFCLSSLTMTIVNGQGQDEDYPNVADDLNDPLRRTLGLLGRVLRRMAQKKPPTDEELHFQVNDPPDMHALTSLIRTDQKTKKGADRIVSQELLNRLIPRIKGEPAPPPKTTTVSMTQPPTTTQTTPTTTTTTTTAVPTTTPTTTTATEKSTRKSSLTVRVKSLEEMSAESGELNDDEIRHAKIIAEALKILLKEQGMDATESTDKIQKLAESMVTSQTIQVVSTTAPTETTTTAEKNTSTASAIHQETRAHNLPTTTETNVIDAEDELKEESGGTKEGAEYAKTESLGRSSIPSIPEAEEEERVSDSFVLAQQAVTTTTTSTLTGQTVYNLNANSQSASDPAMSNVFTPVNAIVDGIGPLILPLIGYSRNALSQYLPRAAAQGVTSYQPNDDKPVQLRTLQSYSPDSTWNQEIARARGQKIQQLRNTEPIDLSRASNTELLQALARSAENNPDLMLAIQEYQSSKMQQVAAQRQEPQHVPSYPQQYQQQQQQQQVTNRPYSRYIPSPASQSQQHQPQHEDMSYLRNKMIQEKLVRAMRGQEVVGSTRATEAPYFAPDLDKYIGQAAHLREPARQHKQIVTQALPTDPNPDPAYAQGLQKVSNFMGDSGVMLEDPTPSPSTAKRQPVPIDSFTPPAPQGHGFGGGRRPNFSFEDVEKNTEEDSLSFFG